MNQLPKHVDGSPVTMHDWGMPREYQPDKVSWTSHNGNISYTFPHFSDSWKNSSLCCALLFVEPAEPVLHDIPCDLPFPDAVFLCERQAKNLSPSLGNRTMTMAVCPHEWVAVDSDCYALCQLNLSSRLPEDGLCQNGEIVNYGKGTELAPHVMKAHANFFWDPNDVLIFLSLWLDNTKANVLLMNGVSKNQASWEKYIVITLPQRTEHVALSALESMSGTKRYLTSFQTLPLSLASHVFCRTSQDHVRNSCETNQFTCDNGTCILEM